MEQPRVLVAITSYNRFNSLCDLTFKLLQNDNVDIAIFDDCSDFDIDRFGADDLDIYIRGKAERLPKGRMTVVKNPEHRGKAGFWKTYNDIFAYCKEHDYDYYIILPDDVEPCPEFVKEAIASYENAGKPICLSPLLTNRSLAPGISRWGRKPIERKDGYYLTNYFDCCGIMRRDFFEALDWHLDEILPSGNPFRSSGVGRQITLRLQALGKAMGHTKRTLLATTDAPSTMNAEERKRHPMYANWRDNADCVDVHMAALWRDGHVVKTAESLLRQPELATLYVTLNSYTKEQYDWAAASLKSLAGNYGKKVVIRKGQNKKGSNEKLAQLPKSKAKYIAFADDDIIYPSNHLMQLIAGVNIHDGACSLHGSVLKRWPIRKYYFGDREMKAWNIGLDADTRVDIIGSGVGMIKREWFTADELKALYQDAPEVSMDDIIISCLLSKKGISRWVMEHQPGCIATKAPAKTDNYVYEQYKNNDAAQVAYINTHYHRNR